jgi:anaerobic magnesium-protoporphyrin IX monomethyl ester cyclase
MRVAVIYPEVLDMARYRERRKEFPPFGALYIAGAVEQAGHEVAIFKIDPTCMVHDLTEFDAIAYSISASATFNLFIECMARSPIRDGTLLMAGGVHVNLLPEQTLRDLGVDVVGIGEGEDTIVEILEHARDRDFSGINGVGYLDADDRFVTTPKRMIAKNIDRFPLPARHLIPPEDFVMSDRMSNTDIRMTHIMPGRGCPFPCRYCASAQTRVQYRSGEDIARELRHLMDNYGIRGFAVVGNDFILSKANVSDICGAISELDLQWATLTRVDRVDPVILRAMADAGCYELEYGVESGSQRILDAMDKRATIDQVRYALAQAHALGIKNKVFLVHGFPGEDMASTEETMRLLDDVGDQIERVSLFRFVPLPGTFVFNNPAMFDIRGLNTQPGWDGNWGKYHIHHNHHHWWGSPHDFERLTEAYWKLQRYVEARWPSRISLDELPPDLWTEQSDRMARHQRETPRIVARA